MNRITIAVIAATLVTASYVLAADAAAPAPQKKQPGKGQLQLLAADAKWEEPFGPGMIKTAEFSGDKKKGPYQLFMKFPAGYDSGWHTHDADYTGIVISGTLENIEQGGEADAKPMGPGSAWSQPAKRNHVTRCSADGECMAFLSIKGGFTFHPMTPEGKPAPAPKKDDKAPDAAKK